MGIKVEDFLYDYFSLEQLKDVLSDIGTPAGGNKKECVDKILEKWTSYNRSWYDLLHFLDTDDLENICDHFKIEYTDWDSEDTMMDKIEEDRVLDFKKTPKKTSQKKYEKKQSTLNIQGNNINIGNNYKINSDNATKINSDNSTKINSDNSFYAKLSDNQKKGFIIGLIGILATVGVGTYQIYDSAMQNWDDSSDITEQSLAKLLKEGNVVEFNKIKQTWVGQLNFDGIDLSDMDLTGVNLNDASLHNAQFDGAILTQAHFNGANLESANFRSATLDRADFVDSNLQKAFLRNSDLELANLNRAEMQNANLNAANLKYASLIEAQLQNANLGNSEFNFADLRDANLEGAILNNTDFLSVKNLPISNEDAKERGAEVD